MIYHSLLTDDWLPQADTDSRKYRSRTGFLVARGDGRVPAIMARWQHGNIKSRVGIKDSNLWQIKTGGPRDGTWSPLQGFMEMANRTWCSWGRYNWVPQWKGTIPAQFPDPCLLRPRSH